MDPAALIVPAFIAGLITFMAPCTLPLVPAFLGFIGGATGIDPKDAAALKVVKRKVVTNGIFYVIGFTTVFVVLGTAFGLGGAVLARHRDLFTRVGGVFVIIFGLYMMNVLKLPMFKFLLHERRFRASRFIRPGEPASSFVFGATFALGWSPCVGPILGSILLLASASATAGAGAMLLLIFSMGLALPFLTIALAFGHATDYTKALSVHLPKISLVGGVFLVFLGSLMVANHMDLWLSFAYRLFVFIDYDALLDYL